MWRQVGKQYTSGVRPWLKNVACLNSLFVTRIQAFTPPDPLFPFFLERNWNTQLWSLDAIALKLSFEGKPFFIFPSLRKWISTVHRIFLEIPVIWFICLPLILDISQCLRDRILASDPRLRLEFLPRCNSNGSYHVLQCSVHLDKCWCVDQSGHKIADALDDHQGKYCGRKEQKGKTGSSLL